MKTKLFILFIILQVGVIAYLSIRIVKNNNILGLSITPIDKNSVVQGKKNNLKYFYDLAPNKTTITKRDWLDYSVENKTNNDALHDKYEYSPKKDRGTFRIMTLGDSFTYGQFVKTSENWTELLEDSLNIDTTLHCNGINKYEVINLGVPGYDIQYSMERFVNRGTKYNPDLILWLINSNDFTSVNELLYDKAQKYRKEMEKNGELKASKENGKHYPFWSKAYTDYISEFGEEKLLQFARDNLDRFVSLYKGNLQFLSFPYLHSKDKLIIQNITRGRENIYFYDKITDLRSDRQKYLFADGHPNIEGHRAIAQDVFQYLIGSNLIPCK